MSRGGRIFRASRSNKYEARKVQLDGYTFDSNAEAKRYKDLKLLVNAGKIKSLAVHPAWLIVFHDVPICRVILDFQYYKDGCWIFEDVKGVDTPLSRLKRKLLKAFYGIDVELIR